MTTNLNNKCQANNCVTPCKAGERFCKSDSEKLLFGFGKPKFWKVKQETSWALLGMAFLAGLVIYALLTK